MRLEHIPLIIGVIVALIGLGFIADASMAAAAPVTPERRRRTRAEPSRAGEAVVGIGTLCMAAALFGRDTWRYGTVAVLAGSALLLIGVILNRAFLKEALLFRGPARRSEEGLAPRGRPGSGGRGRGTPEPQPPATASGGGSKPAVGTSVRQPTPPVALRAARSREAVDATPTPVAGQARFDSTSASAPPSAPPAAPKPGSPPQPQAPAAKVPDAPSGPKERRKTPRGKR